MTLDLNSYRSPKALLFDLGGVVFDISFEKSFEIWSRHASSTLDRLKARFGPSDAYQRHERGEIEASEYFASLRNDFEVGLSDEQFVEGWNAIFLGEITQTVEVLKRLKTKMPLYAFSNINETHKKFGMMEYADTLALFDRLFFSCDIGMRKPEPDAFAFVASEIGVELSDIIFFDDTEENVSATNALGIQAVLVTSPEDVRSAVAPLL